METFTLATTGHSQSVCTERLASHISTLCTRVFEKLKSFPFPVVEPSIGLLALSLWKEMPVDQYLQHPEHQSRVSWEGSDDV